MLPEWSRFITEVKLNRGLKESNFDKLYAYLKQHEVHANENRTMMERFLQPTNDPLALVSNASVQQYPTQLSKSPQPLNEPSHADNFQLDSGSSSTENLIESLSNSLALLTQSYKSHLPQTNNQLKMSSNERNKATVQDGRVVVQDVRGRYNANNQGKPFQRNNARGNVVAGNVGGQNRGGIINPGPAKPIKCYNCNGLGHIARECPRPKRLQDSDYFKDKMLLMQAQENGAVLDSTLFSPMRHQVLGMISNAPSRKTIHQEKQMQEEMLQLENVGSAKAQVQSLSLQANYVLREIHEGSCSMHAGTRSVVVKALWIGYYWPTMHEDARKLIQACQDCQVYKPVPRNPQQKLSPITSPWPFYKWGIDIAGPFPEGPGKVKFLIVAIDYFTKWIEAKPVATITGSQIKKFVWDNIVCRFGLPGEIISDNGKQFQDNPFKDWCEKLYIRQHFASVKHPQTNGLVERANRSLGEGIKAILDEMSKNWMEEPPHVLWAHHTMIKSSNGDTPSR
ncbi:reverse transcriptase domain-containing protein [Tanacetum coccineum]